MSTERICPICQTLFIIPPTRPNQIYCSRDCSVIGRKLSKEEAGQKRVNAFIESLPDLSIFDVLEGKLGSGTDNRMTVTGARTWQDKRFIILVVD